MILPELRSNFSKWMSSQHHDLIKRIIQNYKNQLTIITEIINQNDFFYKMLGAAVEDTVKEKMNKSLGK